MESISSNNKRIAKNTFFLYVRMFLTMAVSLYTVRMVLNVLTVSDYGIYGAVGGVITSFAFISSTLACASQRFFAYELGKNEKGHVREVFSSVIVLYVFVSILIILLAEMIGLWFLRNKMTIPEDRITASIWVFQFALASFIVSILANPYQAMIIAKEKMNIYAYVSIIDVLLKLIVVFFLTMIDFDKLKLYSVLLFLTTTISNAIYVIYCRKVYAETRIILGFDKVLLKSILNYSSWTMFGTIAGVCNTQGLNLMLNVFFGPIANTAYSIASQVSSHVGNFANNFYSAIRPAIIKSFSSGDYQTVNKYFIFSTKCTFIMMAVLILPIYFNVGTILKLWLNEVYPYMEVFVRLALLYSLLLALSNPITTVVQAQGNVKLYHSLVDGFALLTLPITYMLYKFGCDAYWGYYCMLLIFSVCHILRLYVLKKVFSPFSIIAYLKVVVVPILITTVLSFIFSGLTITYFNSTLGIICHCFLSSVTVLVLSLCILFSNKERIQLLSIFLSKIRFQR